MLVTKRAIHIRFAETGAIVIPLKWRRVYAPAVKHTHPYLIEAVVRTEKYIDMLAPLRVKRERGAGMQPTDINPQGKTREATCICVEKPKPQGYFKLFCAHDRAYWMQCGMCRRDKKEAAANWERLIAKTC